MLGLTPCFQISNSGGEHCTSVSNRSDDSNNRLQASTRKEIKTLSQAKILRTNLSILAQVAGSCTFSTDSHSTSHQANTPPATPASEQRSGMFKRRHSSGFRDHDFQNSPTAESSWLQHPNMTRLPMSQTTDSRMFSVQGGAAGVFVLS